MFLRALIVLLVVLNVGVAAWWLLRDDAPVARPVRAGAAPDLPRLQLVGEAASPAEDSPGASRVSSSGQAPAAGGEPEAATASEPANEPAGMQCFTVGPFQDEAAATAARDALAGRASGSRMRTGQATGSGNWDVAIAPLADRAAAQAMAAKLQAAGFADHYVIAGGEGANGIALGRFSNEDTASRHVAALQAAGFPAALRAPDAVARHWLEVELAEGADPAALRGASGGARVEPRDCPAAG